MEAVLTARPDGGAADAVQILAARIHRADDAAARQLDVLDPVALDQGEVMAGAGVGPVDTRDHNIVAVDDIILIIRHAGGLPQHGPLLDTQLHVVLHLDIGDDVTTAVEGVVTGDNDGAAALTRDRVDGGLDLGGIIGEAVTHGSELRVGDLDRAVGKSEGVGVLGEVGEILDLEAVGHLHRAIGGLHGADEEGGEMGDYAVLQGEREGEVGAVGRNGVEELGTLKAFRPVGDGQLVEVDLRPRVGGVQLALDGDGLGIGEAGDHFSRVVVDGLLPLKGDGVEGDGTVRSAHRLHLEATEVAHGVGAGGEVGVDRLPITVRGHIHQHRMLGGVAVHGGGLEVDTELGGIGIILQTEEDGVLDVQSGAVGVTHGGGDGGGLEGGTRPVQGIDQRAVTGTLPQSDRAPGGHKPCQRAFGGKFQIRIGHLGGGGGVGVVELEVLELGGGVVALHRPDARGEIIPAGIGDLVDLDVVDIPDQTVVRYGELPVIPLVQLHRDSGLLPYGGGGPVDDTPHAGDLEDGIVLKEILLPVSKGIGHAHITVHRGTAVHLGNIQRKGVTGHRLLGGKLGHGGGADTRQDVLAVLHRLTPPADAPIGVGVLQIVIHFEALDAGGGIVALDAPVAPGQRVALGIGEGVEQLTVEVPLDAVLGHDHLEVVPLLETQLQALGRADMAVHARADTADTDQLADGIVLKEVLVAVRHLVGGTDTAVHGAVGVLHVDVELQIHIVGGIGVEKVQGIGAVADQHRLTVLIPDGPAIGQPACEGIRGGSRGNETDGRAAQKQRGQQEGGEFAIDVFHGGLLSGLSQRINMDEG